MDLILRQLENEYDKTPTWALLSRIHYQRKRGGLSPFFVKELPPDDISIFKVFEMSDIKFTCEFNTEELIKAISNHKILDITDFFPHYMPNIDDLIYSYNLNIEFTDSGYYVGEVKLEEEIIDQIRLAALSAHEQGSFAEYENDLLDSLKTQLEQYSNIEIMDFHVEEDLDIYEIDNLNLLGIDSVEFLLLEEYTRIIFNLDSLIMAEYMTYLVNGGNEDYPGNLYINASHFKDNFIEGFNDPSQIIPTIHWEPSQQGYSDVDHDIFEEAIREIENEHGLKIL